MPETNPVIGRGVFLCQRLSSMTKNRNPGDAASDGHERNVDCGRSSLAGWQTIFDHGW
jgi:hypothetical protein